MKKMELYALVALIIVAGVGFGYIIGSTIDSTDPDSGFGPLPYLYTRLMTCTGGFAGIVISLHIIIDERRKKK